MKFKQHVALVVFVSFAFVGFVEPLTGFVRTFAAPAISSPPVPASPAGGFLIFVNSTGDGTNLVGAPNCDADLGTPGEQCTLRAAIQVANLSPGDDGIEFSIPATEPSCDALGNCVINLTGPLPDVSSGMEIFGPGADKLTVRRNSSNPYRVFNVSAPGVVVAISGMTISNGHAFRSEGGGINNASTGTVNITNCVLTGNIGQDGGGVGNFLDGIVNITSCNINDNEGDTGGGVGNRTNGTINITNTTISGNVAGDVGGGIHNRSGTVGVTNSAISENEADAGAGISNPNSGTVNIIDTTISDNTAQDEGGGVSNFSTGTVNVIRSTISDNDARDGGGVENHNSGTVNVTNSTISGNSTFRGRAGGIGNFGAGTVRVTNSTISSNQAIDGSGGGIFHNSTGLVTVKSSLIALNISDLGPDAFGSFNSQGFNLVGKIDGAAGFNTVTDKKGTIAAPLDPKLNPAGLQDNGGPTKTIALLCGSPAIDNGSSAGLTGNLTTDQRSSGFPRSSDDPAIPNASAGDGADTGAYELQQICSEPAPIIVVASAILINESCPPANGAIDPGERVTVYVQLINSGNASTSNLVATLQSSGGVVAPSDSQNFGAVAQGATAGRDFAFTADPALICGATLTATLHLQDGTTDLGNVIFSFTLGVNNAGTFVCTSPCGGVRLVVRSVLSRTSSTTVQASITIENIGTLPANITTLTTAKLGDTNGVVLPQPLGNIAPGGSTTAVVSFNNSTGGALMMTVGGTYNAGSFNSSRRVTVP